MEYGDPTLIPGAAHRRPDHVTLCVPCSTVVREEERQLSLMALIGVQVDARAKLSSEAVRRDALQQLCIPTHELGVKRLTASTFLLHFATPKQSTAVLCLRGLAAGQTALRLMPWTHQVSASAAKLMYRARIETIAKLFNAPTFIEGIDNEHEIEQERDCLCLWVWTDNPDGLAKMVSLQVAEPLSFSDEYYWKMGEFDLPTSRSGPAEMLKYNVIIHLDRVLDYSPLPSSLSHESVHRGITGLPDDLYEEEWPVKHHFVWHYGVIDDRVVRCRVPVQERLSGRRGRSPSGEEMEIIDKFVVRETLGSQFARSYTYLTAQATRGGVLLAVHEDYYNMSYSEPKNNTLTAKLEATIAPISWWIMGVCGP
uniref:Uncharacterized protein n=1 Tax=Setaria viridis TaxID=4556 RepID=A0A4U6V9L8_SETVI|nr:hypothetical protein SEVIR_3G159000v2 [Setaria viridis]